MILGYTMPELFGSLLVAPVLRTFVQYLIEFCNGQVAASDVICGKYVGPIAHDKCVKFCHHRLTHSGEIRPDANRVGIFKSFFSR